MASAAGVAAGASRLPASASSGRSRKPGTRATSSRARSPYSAPWASMPAWASISCAACSSALSAGSSGTRTSPADIAP